MCWSMGDTTWNWRHDIFHLCDSDCVTKKPCRCEIWPLTLLTKKKFHTRKMQSFWNAKFSAHRSYSRWVVSQSFVESQFRLTTYSLSPSCHKNRELTINLVWILQEKIRYFGFYCIDTILHPSSRDLIGSPKKHQKLQKLCCIPEFRPQQCKALD
jgi:hypothetical protein